MTVAPSSSMAKEFWLFVRMANCKGLEDCRISTPQHPQYRLSTRGEGGDFFFPHNWAFASESQCKVELVISDQEIISLR